MIGGTVCEIIACGRTLWINCEDRGDRCAIYIVWSGPASHIAIGDSVWWQMDKAYHTPVSMSGVPTTLLKKNLDYDIQLNKLGSSGAQRPIQIALTTPGQTLADVLGNKE